MEQDEITRRNVAIAEYMELPGILNPDFKDMLAETLCYNHKWEWIMTAVEKITKESNLGFHSWLPMSSDNPKMFHSKLHGAFWLIEGMDKPLIERVWLVVSEYVLSLGE